MRYVILILILVSSPDNLLLKKISFNKIKSISIANSTSEEEICLIQEICIKNKFYMFICDYKDSIISTPNSHKYINLFPTINLVFTEKLSALTYFHGKQDFIILSSENFILEKLFKCVSNFLLDYTKDNINDESKSSQKTTDNKFKHLLEKFCKSSDVIQFLIDFDEVSQYQEINTLVKEKWLLKFNNCEGDLYFSRLRALFESQVYINSKSKNRVVVSNEKFIINSLKKLIDSFVTYVNFQLYTHLLLLKNQGISVKEIVINFKN